MSDATTQGPASAGAGRDSTGRAGAEALVRIDGVRKRYGDHEVLKGISLEVARGEVVVLLGPSGSGKSTLLRCINHLESIDGGTIRVGDELMGYRQAGSVLHELPPKQIARQRRPIGMVFQKFNLFPHMTVLENIIEAPIGVRGQSRAAAVDRARELLAQVGLSAFESHYPAQLSGGQQQRIAIARSLAMDPELMLFDEPTSALDPELVGDVLNVMRDLAEHGMTMIVVTHEIGFARSVADQVVFMADGVVVESGPPSQVIEAPRHQRTRAFLQMVE